MSQDERMYPNPTEFCPERFLNNTVTDPKNMIFGFGRRYAPACRFLSISFNTVDTGSVDSAQEMN